MKMQAQKGGWNLILICGLQIRSVKGRMNEVCAPENTSSSCMIQKYPAVSVMVMNM